MKRKTKAERRGASSVEFALIFPIILTFFVAMAAFTQAILLRDTAQHAAYEAARKGQLLQVTNEEMVEAAEDFLSIVRVRSPEIIIDPEVITNVTENVTVVVHIPFQENAWIGGAFMPDNWTMSARVSLQRFRSEEQ